MVVDGCLLVQSSSLSCCWLMLVWLQLVASCSWQIDYRCYWLLLFLACCLVVVTCSYCQWLSFVAVVRVVDPTYKHRSYYNLTWQIQMVGLCFLLFSMGQWWFPTILHQFWCYWCFSVSLSLFGCCFWHVLGRSSIPQRVSTFPSHGGCLLEITVAFPRSQQLSTVLEWFSWWLLVVIVAGIVGCCHWICWSLGSYEVANMVAGRS